MKLDLIIDYNFKNWPFLHTSMIPNTMCTFYGTDQESLLIRNKTYQSVDWVYHNKPVNYYFNDIGLRMKKNLSELKKNIIFNAGTSYAFGVGVDQDDIYGSILQRETNYDVINYAGPAFSIRILIYTFFNYIKLHGIPKIAIFELPPVQGWTWFNNTKAIMHAGRSHQPIEEPYYLEAFKILESNTDFCKNENAMLLHILRIFCNSHKIKLFEFSYYPDDYLVQHENLRCIDMDKLQLHSNSEKYARDLRIHNGYMVAHPGIGVHKKTAEEIIKSL